MILSDAELDRFSRQVILPSFGEENQLRLMASHVAVIGAGGLGAPVIQYLAAAGMGRLTIIDDDRIEPSNLNRQVIHRHEAIGTMKAHSAKNSALALNPDMTITAITSRFGGGSATDSIGDATVLADCSDTAETRFAVNRAAHRLGRVMVFGGAVGMVGQVSSFDSNNRKDSPCFACVFPKMPDRTLAPRCSEVGILGTITGVIGTLMATEILRQCLKPDEPLGADLVGKLLLFDGLATTLTTITLNRNPNCPICGDTIPPRQKTN